MQVSARRSFGPAITGEGDSSVTYIWIKNAWNWQPPDPGDLMYERDIRVPTLVNMLPKVA